MKFRSLYEFLINLTLVFALVLIGAAQCYAISEDKQVILYTYLFDPKGDNPGDPDLLFSDFEKQISRVFPERPVRKVVATDSASLKSQLDHILGKDEVISHLVIRGHGYSFKPFNYRDKGKFISSGIQVGQSDMIECAYPADQGIEKLLPEELGEILDEVNRGNIDLFSGIRGRLIEGAQVLITSCNLLEGTQDEARRKAQGIAHVLGLKNGNLYANRNQGLSNRNFLLNPKVQVISWGLALGSWSLGCPVPASALIGSLPLAFLYSRSRHIDRTLNQGYHCSISEGKIRIAPSTKNEYEQQNFMALELGPKRPLGDYDLSKILDNTLNPVSLRVIREGHPFNFILNQEGVWYTSIWFPGKLGSIRFFSDEAITVAKKLLKQSAPPTLESRFRCGLYECSEMRFKDGDAVTVYTDDVPKLINAFTDRGIDL